MRLHFLLPFVRQLKSARRNDAFPYGTLDYDSWKCDSLSCETTEKVFRNAVSGAFFFCGESQSISVERSFKLDETLTIGRASLLRWFQ